MAFLWYNNLKQNFIFKFYVSCNTKTHKIEILEECIQIDKSIYSSWIFFLNFVKYRLLKKSFNLIFTFVYLCTHAWFYSLKLSSHSCTRRRICIVCVNEHRCNNYSNVLILICEITQWRNTSCCRSFFKYIILKIKSFKKYLIK